MTTIVESKNRAPIKDSNYQILFGAALVEPFYVTLVDPVEIPKRTWNAANELWTSNQCGVEDWRMWLQMQRPSFRKIYSPANRHEKRILLEQTIWLDPMKLDPKKRRY